MSKLLSANRAMRGLKKLGFIGSTVKGSHVVLRHPKTETVIVFPFHAGQITNERIQSIRRTVTGRGAATSDEFDRAMGLVRNGRAISAGSA